MTSTSRHDEDRVDELETIEEVLLSLEPDEIDYVNKLPLYLQDEAARRLALSGLSRELQGERRQFVRFRRSMQQSVLTLAPLRRRLSLPAFNPSPACLAIPFGSTSPASTSSARRATSAAHAHCCLLER